MRSGVWQRLDLLARNLLPFVFTIFLITFGMVPLRLPEIAPVAPALALIAVYFWTVYRPDLMPQWAVFLIGLFQDLLSGGVVGVWVLTLLLVQLLVRALRRTFVGASFIAVWMIFAMVALGAEFTAWLLNSAFYLRLVDPEPAMLQAAMTLAVYPVLAWLFTWAQRAFLR